MAGSTAESNCYLIGNRGGTVIVERSTLLVSNLPIPCGLPLVSLQSQCYS